jgi:hypothetical protein
MTKKLMTNSPQSLLEKIRENPDLLASLPKEVKMRVFELMGELEERKASQRSQDSFMTFVNRVWPSFIYGAHHKKMADAFERVAAGKIKRLIINMPPRHTKSEFASYLLPAWFLGKFPHKKVIQTSHTAELAVNFGRKVRNIVDQDTYKEVFPGVGLQADSKAAGRWATNKGGEYFAIGVGVLSPVKERIFSLLTTLIANKRLLKRKLTRKFTIKPMSGTHQGHDSDSSRGER